MDKYAHVGKQVVMAAHGGEKLMHVADAGSEELAAAIAEALNLRVGELEYRGADAADAPDALAPTESSTLLETVTRVIKMGYISVSTSTVKAQKVAENVLEAVMAFYQQAAEAESKPVVTRTEKKPGDRTISLPCDRLGHSFPDVYEDDVPLPGSECNRCGYVQP